MYRIGKGVDTVTFTCSPNGDGTKMIHQTIQTGPRSTAQETYGQSQADKLLDEAEAALKKSEELTRDQLGVSLDTTVNSMLNKTSDEMEDFLSQGRSEFDSDAFLQKLFKAVHDKESDTSAKLPKSTAKPVLSSAAQKVADASASLMTTYKRLYEQKRNRDHDNLMTSVSMRYPQMYAALKGFGLRNYTGRILSSNDEFKSKDKNFSEISTKSTAIHNQGQTFSNASKRQPVDQKCKIPMYVDGTQDSKSESSISSSILESQNSLSNPTQPQSPPVDVSSLESDEKSILLLEDTPPAQDEKDDSDDVSSVSDFSTITISTHGTFATENQSVDLDHSYSVAVRPDSQGEKYYNGTCNVDLDVMMEGDSECKYL